MLAAALAALPPYRANGDDDTVQRIIRRPNSALEAGARAPMELIYGLSSALGGLVLDPVTVRGAGRGGWDGQPCSSAMVAPRCLLVWSPA